MKKLLLIIIGLISLISVGVVFAVESIKYDFDDVEVKYAVEFTAKPVNIDPNNWVVQIAGGIDKPITILYGIMNFKNSGGTQSQEEFIKISGAGGYEKFVVNGIGYDYYEGTSNYKYVKSFFWSAKKLVDNSVVKDFTQSINSITLYRKFNESQQLSSILLSFSNDGNQASSDFWSSVPKQNLYEADINTLNQFGISIMTTAK